MMNKTKLPRALLAAALIAAVALPAAAASFRPGSYNAVGSGGHGGDISVTVVFDASSMVSITVASHSETPAFANMAFAQLIPAMIAAQTHDVDILAGATYTSTALREAVRRAIEQASN
jgi:uncharacterized protein with FMN-binding domain